MKNLVILQNKPTQFDVPLFNKIALEKPFNLTVIYSQTESDVLGVDREIGRSPNWDHIEEENYCRIDLVARQIDRLDQIVDRIASLKPDLVVVSGYFPPLHRRVVQPLKKKGIKVGLRSDNTLPHSNFKGLKGLIKKLILPVWLRRYDSWHPVGSMAKEYLESVAKSGIPTYLFPYNVDNKWFFQESKKVRENKTKLISEIGFPSDCFIILGIMKWHNREDPITLIEGFRKLLMKNSAARLILVGDGPLRDRVESCLEPIAEKVFTPGYVSYSELPKYYGLADIFVHPAPDEPWGVSVNEAMACGIPVIVAEGVGSGKDLVVENQTGYVFNDGDADELAKLLWLVSNCHDRDTMGKSCISKMREWNYFQTISEFQRGMGELS